jgi:hypothetical protein
MYVKKPLFYYFVLCQSDVVHQSVYELVHSEDREELQRQLHWNSFISPDQNLPLQVNIYDLL